MIRVVLFHAENQGTCAKGAVSGMMFHCTCYRRMVQGEVGDGKIQVCVRVKFRDSRLMVTLSLVVKNITLLSFISFQFHGFINGVHIMTCLIVVDTRGGPK